jgi:hypothetical protein
MAGPHSKFIWTLLLFASVSPVSAQGLDPRDLRAAPALTCDSRQIDAQSYALTTRAQSHIVNEDRSSWWDGFNIGKHADDLYDLNTSATYAAERALELDPRNLLAHGLLARQYVVIGEDATLADRSWRAVLDNGGAVVWTSTLYDVDYKSYFLMAFDRQALRIYRYGELAGPFDTHLGMPQFVGEDRERFWRAMAGCIDPGARPEAVIPWSEVREIKAGNWVLWFKLTRPVTITSDRGKKKTLNEIKVNLHGATGTIDVLTSRDVLDPTKVSVRPMGIGPLAYQQRVRFTLVKFVDPAGRIKLPKASRSAGW